MGKTQTDNKTYYSHGLWAKSLIRLLQGIWGHFEYHGNSFNQWRTQKYQLQQIMCPRKCDQCTLVVQWECTLYWFILMWEVDSQILSPEEVPLWARRGMCMRLHSHTHTRRALFNINPRTKEGRNHYRILITIQKMSFRSDRHGLFVCLFWSYFLSGPDLPSQVTFSAGLLPDCRVCGYIL